MKARVVCPVAVEKKAKLPPARRRRGNPQQRSTIRPRPKEEAALDRGRSSPARLPSLDSEAKDDPSPS